MNRMLDAAIRQAEDRAEREGMRMVVWYDAGPDAYGRSGVFYVRAEYEGRPWEAERIHTVESQGKSEATP